MAARPPSSCLEPRCVGPGKLPQHHHGASAILGTCTQTRGMDVHVHEYTPCRAVLLLLQGPGATSRTTRACTHATLCCCCCRGQMLPPGESAPVCSPSNAVDFELEMVSSSRSVATETQAEAGAAAAAAAADGVAPTVSWQRIGRDSEPVWGPPDASAHVGGAGFCSLIFERASLLNLSFEPVIH